MNTFKAIFGAVMGVIMISGCSHRGSNPYAVKTQNNRVSVDLPVSHTPTHNVTGTYVAKDVVQEQIDNVNVERIIRGN